MLPQTMQQTVQEGGKKGTPKAEPQVPMEETWQMQGGRGRGRKGKGKEGKGKGKGGRGMGTCYSFQRGACERENCLFEHVLVEPVAADKQWAELTRERLWMRRAVEKTARRHAAWPKKPTPARAAEEKVLAARQKERVRVLALYDEALAGDRGKLDELRRYKDGNRSKEGNGRPSESSGTSAGKKPATQSAPPKRES